MIKRFLPLLFSLALGASDPMLDEADRMIHSKDEAQQRQGALLYEKMAQDGVAEAEFNYGYCLFNGIGIEKNPREGVVNFFKAAYQGHTRAMYYMGLAYTIGEGVPKDAQLSLQWLLKAAEAGNVAAQFYLSMELGKGTLLEKNPKESLFWLRKAASSGHSWPRRELAYHLGIGDLGEKDLSFALKELEILTKGDSEDADSARITLATWYVNGVDGVEQDYQRAIDLLLPLGEKGDPRATNILGRIYARLPLFNDVANQERAKYWLTRPGDNMSDSDLLSMASVVLMINREEPAEQLRQARYWFGRVSDRKEVASEIIGYTRFCLDNKVPCRISAALELLLEAAREGSIPDTPRLLGGLALLGRGGSVTGLQGIHWYRQAAPHLTEAHGMAGLLSWGKVDEAFALLRAEPWNRWGKVGESSLPPLP
ncbi:MAG: sel1 repeat family protein, partial [Magnetococcales bacterium]|nr:sel1 repeat family protein [Magnetococcales bacterium]